MDGYWQQQGATTSPITRVAKAAPKFLNSFTIGCDPEFCVLDGSNIVEVSDLFPADGAVGWDHSGRVVELRPEQSRSIIQVLQNIQNLIRHSSRLERIANFRWRAGAYIRGQVIGGHIHFGTTSISQRISESVLDLFTDGLVALDILPEAEATLRLNRLGTDFEKFRLGNDYQSNMHWEYRRPASWLFHPNVAALCLGMSKIAVAEPRTFMERFQKRRGLLALANVARGFRSDPEIEWLYEKVIQDRLHFDPDVDFRESWLKLKLPELG